MKRREFLSLSAVAAVAAPGCAHLPARAADPALLDVVTDVLDQLDHNVRARFRGVQTERLEDLRMLGAMEDLWSGLAVYSAFLELPLADQVHPGVQQRIVRAARAFWSGASAVRDLVGAEDATLWARMEAARTAIVGGVDVVGLAEAEVRAVGVRGLGRRRFNALMQRCSKQLARQEARKLTASLGTQLDEAVATPVVLPAETVAEVTAAVEGWRVAGHAPSTACDTTTDTDRKVMSLLGIGFIVIGGVLIVVGVALILALPECICIGGAVALIGVGMLIPGIIVLANAGKDPAPDPAPAAAPG